MRCRNCQKNLGKELLALAFAFRLVINKQEKSFKFRIPICVKCCRDYGVTWSLKSE